MRHLRSLNWVAVLLTGSLLPFVAWAEAPTVGFSVTSFSQTGATHLNLLENSQAGGGQVTEVTASTGLMSQGFRLNLSANSMERDLGDYNLVRRDGSVTSLGETFDGQEQMAKLGVDYVKGAVTIATEFSQTMNKSPLSQKQTSLSLAYQFFKTGSQLTLSHVRATQEQPQSYYVDPDSFETKQRATQLNPAITKLSYDQILGERVKSQFHILSGQRPEDRPGHLGAGMRMAYAMGDTWALHAGAETLRESRSDSLKDSRGYFSLNEFDFGVALEPLYNLVIRASVGTAIEKESARGSLPQQTVGTDKLDLLVEYRKARLTLYVQGNLQESNTDFKASQITGGATWEI